MFPKNKRMLKSLIVFVLAITSLSKGFGQDLGNEPSAKLTRDQIASFREQAVKSIFDLNKYIVVIADKANSMVKRDQATGLALDLFQSDTVSIEISSIKTGKKHIDLIKSYLRLLKFLPYSSIKISWYKVYLAPSFTLGPDGNYYGSATFLQKFEGKSNTEAGAYKDITKRHIILILKKIDAYQGAEKINKYVLKLGDISVEETSNG